MFEHALKRQRARQSDRYAQEKGVTCNSQASGRLLLAQLDTEARELLESTSDSFGLSARWFHRVIKVSRTVADLAHYERIAAVHVAESLRYRPGVAAGIHTKRLGLLTS